MRPRRDYIDTGRGQLHYRGNAGGAQPLLLLHQSPSDSRMYEKLMAELDGEYWLLAPDNPGFGCSDPLPGGFTLEGCADAMLTLLDRLEIARCLLFGHHTGASVAVRMASLAPRRFSRIALCGPPLLDPALRSALPGLGARFPLEPDGSHLRAMWARMSGKEPDAPPELLTRETMSAFAAGEAYPRAYAAVAEQDFEAQLRAITVPTLVFAGTEDILHGRLRPALECLRQGAKAEIPGAGSYVCERRPAAVARLLREFYGP